MRSHAAGSLRSTDAGQTVTLAGWVARRRDNGRLLTADSPDQLRELIVADYAAQPVPREVAP